MNTKPLLLLLFGLIAFINHSCDRTVEFIPPTDDVSPVAEVFQNQELTIHEFKVEATIGDTLTLDDQSGFAPTILVIPENLCTYGNGEACQGELQVQLIQAFTKGDMIFSNVPTSSEGIPLASGGAFYLNITQNDQQLQISPDASFLIKASVERTEGQNTDMKFYQLVSDTVDSVVQNDWILQGDLAGIDEVYYTLEFDELDQWMNIDVPIDESLSTYSVKVSQDQLEIPDADVYLALANFNSVIKAEYDELDGLYKADIPENSEFEIVAINKEGEEWFWDVHLAEETEELSTLELKLVVYQELVTKLKSL